MSSVINCPNCKQVIAKGERSCPYCNSVLKKSSGNGRAVLAVVVVIIAAFGIPAIYNSTESSTSTSDASPRTAVGGGYRYTATSDAPKVSAMQVFSPIESGMLGAALCNKSVDTDVAVAYVKSKFGNTFTANETVDVVFMMSALPSLHVSLNSLPKTKKDLIKYCTSMMQIFGPDGTDIPGLIKP